MDNKENLTPEQEQILEQGFKVIDEQFVKIINLGALETNSIISFRVDQSNLDLIMSLPLLCEKYANIFKEKNIGVIILGPSESIETLNEKQMNKIGWFKKEESRIITLS